MKRYIAAVDQGTTSTRFLVFDRRGRVVAGAQKEHAQICPHPGWVEHDAEEIWRNAREVIAEAMSAGKLRADDLAAVGITNQRETVVVWDRETGEPVHHALVWQDMRVQGDVDALAREGGIDRLRAKTGLPLSPYFSALKLKWILDHAPEARRKAAAGKLLAGTIDTYLAWRLTGRHVTDVTNAGRTQLMDLRASAWGPDLLALFDVPREVLPEIASSSEVYGEIAVPELRGVPLAGLLGDQQAALFGQACFEPGQAKNTYGTGCFLLMNTGETPVPSKSGLLTTPAYKLGDAPPRYALEGGVAIAGALVQWLRDNLGLIAASDDVEALAKSVPDNGGVYIVPAFSGLYAPHWRADARGVIAGLTRHSRKGHFARAALEATAFQTRELVSAMEKDSGARLDALRVDGGMTRNETLMQFQADILDRPVVLPPTSETTALGAAYAAGLAVGYFKDLDELRANWSAARVWTPNMKEAERAALCRDWDKALARSLDWVEP